MKSALHFLRIAGTLLLITALVAAALAGVNAITKDRIATINAEKVQAAIYEVLPGAEIYGQVDLENIQDDTGMVRDIYESNKGFAVKVVVPGFGGDITMMVGVGLDGTVLGISVVEQAETAGLGAIIADKGDKGISFRESYQGLTGPISVSKDGGQADTITGATITSRAVAEGVNAALNAVKSMIKED